MTNTDRSIVQGGVITAGVATLLSLTGTASTAQAAHYQVFTNQNVFADTVAPGDNYCSLVEAVTSINNGSSVDAKCRDIDPSNPGQITLIETPGQSYSAVHFNIRGTQITFKKSIRIQPSEEGFRAYIDSSGALAMKVNASVEVNLYGLDIRHTGAGAGRLLWNAGTLNLGSSFVRNGNVKPNNPGIGGGIYNEKTGTLSVAQTEIVDNQANKGGGIYNDGGNIPYLYGKVSRNSATIAGGGLYNAYVDATHIGTINLAATISSNSANSGGGIANVGGWIIMMGSTTITANKTVDGSTSTKEVCHAGACTGNGGGVLNLDVPEHIGQFDIGTTDRATISANVATKLGGGIYSTGYMNLGNITMGGSSASSGNRAFSGAAVYSAALPAPGGTYPHYCEFTDNYGTSSFRYNVATGTPSWAVFSVLDTSGQDQTYVLFRGASGSNNSSPFCEPGSVRDGSVCPQQ